MAGKGRTDEFGAGDRASLPSLSQEAALKYKEEQHPRLPNGRWKDKDKDGSKSGDGSKEKNTKNLDNLQNKELNALLKKSGAKKNGLDSPDDLKNLRDAFNQSVKSGKFANKFINKLPRELRGEAKMTIAKAMEKKGFDISYTKYEDGSKAPTKVNGRKGYVQAEDGSYVKKSFYSAKSAHLPHPPKDNSVWRGMQEARATMSRERG